MSASFLQRLENAAQKHQQALDLTESKREADACIVVQQFIDSHPFPFTFFSVVDVKQTILEIEQAVIEHVENHGKYDSIVFHVDIVDLGNFSKIRAWLYQCEADFDKFTAGGSRTYVRPPIYDYVNGKICTFVERFHIMWLSLYPSIHLDVYYGKSSFSTEDKFKHSSKQPIRTLTRNMGFSDLAINKLVLHFKK